jgi:phosphopantothenoylcysteine synthetase/decarboxylase
VPEKKSGREIILGVTGSIAAYKAVQLASDMVGKGVAVTVIMTDNAMRFITPLSFETITKKSAITDLQCDPSSRVAEHISLSDRCSALVIAPATANIIGKIACGIADDILSTTALSFPGPIIIAPAMNTIMWENSVVQENVKKLESLNCTFVGPGEGKLADGRMGVGRLADLSEIEKSIDQILG